MPSFGFAERNDDDIVKSRHSGASRRPGYLNYLESMDSGLRQNDTPLRLATFYEVINYDRRYKDGEQLMEVLMIICQNTPEVLWNAFR